MPSILSSKLHETQVQSLTQTQRCQFALGTTEANFYLTP